MSQSLDDLRAQFPELGFAVYAMEPRGLVTLEIYAPDGQTYSFKGESEAAVIEQAFPPVPAPEPTPLVVNWDALKEPANVFD